MQKKEVKIMSFKNHRPENGFVTTKQQRASTIVGRQFEDYQVATIQLKKQKVWVQNGREYTASDIERNLENIKIFIDKNWDLCFTVRQMMGSPIEEKTSFTTLEEGAKWIKKQLENYFNS